MSQLQLAGEPPAQVPEPERAPDFLSIVATRKAGREGWVDFKWEAVGGEFLVEGGVPRILKAGKRKGRPTWKGQPTSRVIVTHAEIEAEAVAYEASTGNCRLCGGSKLSWSGWSAAEGNRYQTCRRCNGTGAPVRFEAVPHA